MIKEISPVPVRARLGKWVKVRDAENEQEMETRKEQESHIKLIRVRPQPLVADYQVLCSSEADSICYVQGVSALLL